VRTIIDGGGQDCKALRVDKHGALVDFRMNVKCAAGTGRALELMAESLGVDVSQLGPLSQEASAPVILNKLCCILTQIDIKRLVLEGRNRADIAAGINESAARYILQLARGLGLRKDIAMTGGMAKNIGVVRCLEQALGTEFVKFPVEPDVIGAIGAAVLAADGLRRSSGL
jgi:predicted CoA-substrate-specific enzyme activase